MKSPVLAKLQRSGEWHRHRRSPSIPLQWIVVGLLPAVAAWIFVFLLLPALFAPDGPALAKLLFWSLFLAINLIVGFAAYCLTFVALARILGLFVSKRYVRGLALSGGCLMWVVATLAFLWIVSRIRL